MRAEVVMSESAQPSTDALHHDANAEESGIFETRKLGRTLSAVWITDGAARWIRLSVWLESVQSEQLLVADSIPDEWYGRRWLASDDPKHTTLAVTFVRTAKGAAICFAT